MSSFPSREADSGLTDDSTFSSGASPFDGRIASKTAGLPLEFTKVVGSRDGDKPVPSETALPTPGGDENSCPNADTVEHRLSATLDEKGDAFKQTPSIVVEREAAGDSPATDCFNDVSMMSVDGHMSVDFGCESVDTGSVVEASESHAGNSTFRRSDQLARNDQIDSSPTASEEQRSRVISTGDSGLRTPMNTSMLSTTTTHRRSTRRSTSICDDDLFLTPTQDVHAVREPPTPSSESPSDTSTRLNRTFDKPESEVSQIEAKSNGTFDKAPSLPLRDIESAHRSTSKSPDFELRLDSTCQPEEAKCTTDAANRTVELSATPTRRRSSSSFTYKGLADEANDDDKDDDKNENENDNDNENDDDNGQTTPTSKKTPHAAEEHDSNAEPALKEKRSSSFLKRRCSILELSFVSSPKRGNFQPHTPKPAEKSSRGSLINFNESIAFDFSAAAKSAEVNGGVAEMGSFVFSATSGLPVSKSADLFDLSALEQATKSLAPKDEKFTRVSFIAMFDPIKIEDGVQEPKAEKAKTPPNSLQNKVSLLATQRCSTSSPLIKGLPTPVFVKPKPLKISLKTVEVQTDPIPEREPEPKTEDPEPEPLVQREVEAELVKLNDVIESQAKALSTYEEVVKKLIDARRRKLENPDEDCKLKSRLADERVRNKQLEEAVRSVEGSMYSTLLRMQDFRAANEDLRKVVEEQQTALVDTRAELDRCQSQWHEDISARDDEKQKSETLWEETSRAHEKAVSMLKLQLQAKDSEIESLNMQNSIARKEVDSLRGLVNSMKLQ